MNYDLEPNLDSWLVIGTFFSALMTMAIAAIFLIQTRHLKKQTATIMNQTKSIQRQEQNRVRPWIKIEDIFINVILYKNGTRKLREENIITLDPRQGPVSMIGFSINLVNIGLDIAETVYVKSMKKFESFTKEDLWRDGQIADPFPLMPSEDYPFNTAITGDEFENLDNKSVYYGLHVAYKVNDQYQTIGKIWRMNTTIIHPEEYWINEEPVE